MSLLIAQELNGHVEELNTFEEVFLGVVRRLMTKQPRDVCGCKCVGSLLLTGDIPELLAHQLVGLLDRMEVVPARKVLPYVIVDILMDLNLNLVLRNCRFGSKGHWCRVDCRRGCRLRYTRDRCAVQLRR